MHFLTTAGMLLLFGLATHEPGRTELSQGLRLRMCRRLPSSIGRAEAESTGRKVRGPKDQLLQDVCTIIVTVHSDKYK
jgi:hypothetical protein